MSLWSDLVSTALIGTDRRPVPAVPPDSPFVVAPGGGPEGSPARLLETAAALALARRAALPPERGVVLPAAAPPETAATVPPAAAARLAGLLRDQPRGPQATQQRIALIGEWLALAVTHHLLAPAALLPELLEEARTRDQWRVPVAAVGGARAIWLAGLAPNWAWLVDRTVTDDTWHEGTANQRLAYLTGLRRADPDRARDLLVEAWADEPGASRAALLSTLEYGLAAADEETCERALDDRRKEVRTVAAGLLATLRGSAYQHRMRLRGLACLSLDATGELVVTPPAACDDAMRRDGIEPRPPQRTGERAWWLRQVLARTPLSAWRDIEPDPAALLRLPIADDWRPVVHQGWAEATVDQHDGGWALAFVRSDSPVLERAAGGAGALGQAVYQRLDPADAADVAVALLDADDPYVELVLPNCPRPWPEPLVAATLARLRRFGERPGPMMSTLVTHAALAFPPSAAPAATRLAEGYRAEHGDEAHAPFFDRLAETLTFRHRMHQEFE